MVVPTSPSRLFAGRGLGGGSFRAEPGRLLPPPSGCHQTEWRPCRGCVPPKLLGRTLAGGLGGSPSRKGARSPPFPPNLIAAHRLPATPIRWDGGLGGKGGRRVDTRFLCPRGGTGAATAGLERLLTFGLGEWRQVAWRSGCFRSLLFVPGGRQDARLGRSVIFRSDLPECPAEAPRSVRGQPSYSRQVWVRVQGAPCPAPLRS